MNEPTIVVVGGGLSGALAALLLARAGYPVTVCEQRQDPRLPSADGGRNINLGITRQSFQLLADLGLEEDLTRASVPLKGRLFHFPDGSDLYQPYAPSESSARSLLAPAAGVRAVSRVRLNAMLVEKARTQPGVNFHFDSRLVTLDPDAGVLEFRRTTGEPWSASADIILGADGARSRMRSELARLGRIAEEVIPLDYGYKELGLAAEPGGRFPIESHALHLWPQAERLLIALPNPDGSFRCTLFLPHRGPASLETLSDAATVETFLQQSFPHATDLMPSAASDYLSRPVGGLLTVRCWPWHAGRAVLIGDASHAVLPFTGQGVNTGFEDCRVLLRCLQESAPDWPQAFSAFAKQRKEQTDAIASTGIALAPFLLHSLHDRRFVSQLSQLGDV